jgi:hypothetical protein
VSRRRRHQQIQISEAELTHLTDDLDQFHNDVSLPAMRRSVEDLLEANRLTRRRFLFGTGALAVGGVAFAACGSSGKKSASPTTTAANPTGLTGDLQIAAMAASVEILGAQTYQAGLTAAQQGRLGPNVPPAVATFAQTVMDQHQQHAAAWNSILTAAGKGTVTKPDPVVKPGVDQAIAGVKDVPGLAKLALDLENVAAATYLSGIGVIQDSRAIGIAASIQPVEMQHAAILHFVLGQYPVPDAFAKIEGARPPSDYA